MNISLQGYQENVATFEAEEAVQPGNLVKLTANGKVGQCADSDVFIGIAISVREGCAAVQLSGYYQVAFEDTQPSLGWQTLSAKSASAVKTDPAGHLCLVTDVDTVGKIAGIIL